MPSFSSIIRVLKTVVVDAIGVEHAIAPIAEKFLPPQIAVPIAIADDLCTVVQSAILGNEASVAAPQAGTVKSASVASTFQAGLAMTQDILALNGQQVTYPPEELQKFVDLQCAAYQQFAVLKSSIKIVPLPVATK